MAVKKFYRIGPWGKCCDHFKCEIYDFSKVSNTRTLLGSFRAAATLAYFTVAVNYDIKFFIKFGCKVTKTDHKFTLLKTLTFE
jgi:hypothetical protein